MKVIVYQMGKVGSASVYQSLLAHGGVDVEHVHEVDPEYVRDVRRAGPESAEYQRCARLRRLMMSDEPLKIITLVREPIARNVSLLWEQHGAEITAHPERATKLWESLAHDEVLTWFDREFNQVTGINAYTDLFGSKRAFNHKCGWSFVHTGARWALIISCEASDAEKQHVISSYLELDGFELHRHNVNEAQEYAEFRNRFRVTPEYADRMASARYTRHFYSNNQIDAMRERWTER